jgi:predicted nucleic acid-binding protein
MPPRIIVDAGVLVSAYGADGEIRRHWHDSLREYQIVISPEIFIEVESRLRNGEFSLSDSQIKSALKEIVERCEIVRPSPAADPRFEESGGAHLVALAKHRFTDGVSPTHLLTADDRLLSEGEIDACKVVRIENFCNSLRQLQPT